MAQSTMTAVSWSPPGSTRRRGGVLAFNSRCKYHARRCKCHLNSSGALRPSNRSNGAVDVLSPVVNPIPSSFVLQSQHVPFSSVVGAHNRKATHYFYNLAALDLSGYLPGRFWDGLVLQRCQSEQVVQQAMIAIGNAHLDHCTTQTMSKKSLEQYQSALQCLKTYLTKETKPDSELVLMCCILLFAFEKLRNDLPAATLHLESGMAILNKIHRDDATSVRTSSKSNFKGTSKAKKDNIDELTTMFVQLDIEAMMQDLDRGPRLQFVNNDIEIEAADDNVLTSGIEFATPHEAMESWMRICHGVWSFISSNVCYRRTPMPEVALHVIERRKQLALQVKQWRMATSRYKHTDVTSIIEEFSRNPDDESKKRVILDKINALIIESHYFVVKRMLTESLLDGREPSPWDHNPEKLLRTGEQALTLRRTYKQARALNTKKTFSTHVGIVESLLVLSHRTTIPRIRAHAQRLIRDLGDAQNGLTGLTAFFAGYGAPPTDMILFYELPGH